MRIIIAFVRQRWFVFLVLLGFTYLTFFPGLSFAFWKDDWFYLWSVLYEPKQIMTFWLHPGTTIEFLVFAKLLGQNVLLWQHAGMLIKALAALAVMDMSAVLFGSPTIAWLSAIVFATMPLGMESVNWPSAHVTEIITIVFCEATALYIRYLQGKKRLLGWAIALYAFSFFSDPVRIVSLAWVPLWLGYSSIRSTLRRISKLLLIVIVGVIGVSAGIGGWLVLPFFRLWYHSHVIGLALTPKMIRIVFHYPNIVWNVLTGWIVPIPHELNEVSHSVFIKPSSIAGCAVIAIVIVSIWRNRRWIWQNREYKSLMFTGLWICTSVAVQWFPEPRLLPATAHRYFVLPSVGISIFIAWALNKLRGRWIAVGLCMYLLVSWRTTHIIQREMQAFRQTNTVNSIWQVIDGSIKSGKSAPLIVITGEDPMKTNAVDIDAAGHFMLLRWNKGIHQSAIFTTDGKEVIKYLCTTKNNRIMHSLNDVYEFYIFRSGEARDISTSFRAQLSEEPMIHACVEQSSSMIQ